MCQGVAFPLTMWSGKCAAVGESDDETCECGERSSSEAARWSKSGRFSRVAALSCGELNGRRHVSSVISSEMGVELMNKERASVTNRRSTGRTRRPFLQFLSSFNLST